MLCRFSFSSCFLYSLALRYELIFGLPSARLPLGQLLSVSAGGFRDSEERRVCWKKRGRGSAGALQTHQFMSSTPTVLQHSKGKKRVSLLIIVFLLFSMWWKECQWKVGIVYHAVVCMKSLYIVLEQYGGDSLLLDLY